VLRSNPCDLASAEPANARGSRFVLYVEGPSDCYILRTWAGLVSRPLARRLAQNAVILGGRRPARALQHFHELQRDRELENIRGVCVLDRDGEHGDVASETPPGGERPEGLGFFTWPRRHIESYLLVPGAMRRSMRLRPEDPRLRDLLGDLPGDGSGEVLRSVDAKRLLAAKGALAREFGTLLSPARIARCMHRSDLHPDVVKLLTRLQDAASG
jgi:hypothetical protein